MSDSKKDLTRIEDLGEFLHELDGPEDFLPPDLPSELLEESPPEFLPAEDDEAPPAFETTEAFESEASFESGEAFTAGDATEFGSFAVSDDEGLLAQDTTPFELTDAPIEEAVEAPAEEAPPQEGPQPPAAFEAAPADDTFADLTPNDAQMIGEMLEATFEHTEAPTPAPDPAPVHASAAPETFEDTRRFGEALRIDEGSSECNPAFSVVARNIRFLEDSQDILTLLKEAGFPEDMMEQFKRQIDRGTLLIPRISEYAAIYLCHQLRRFRLELSMGPSDLIHPPKKGQEGERGLVSRRTLGQNYQHQFQFKGDADGARAILLSTLSQLDGHAVERYLGVASEHAFLTADVVESEASERIHQSYDELALKLKGHALQSQANAVIGINYQLTPLPDASGLASYRYKLSCTGNLVWLNKLTD